MHNLELEAAEFLIFLCDSDNENGANYTINNIKLQSLLFVAQASYYERYKQFFFEGDVFEVGEYSPIIKKVNDQFHEFGLMPLFLPKHEEFKALSFRQREFMKTIWGHTRSLSTSTILMSMTSNKELWARFFQGKKVGNKISNREIMEFVENLANAE